MQNLSSFTDFFFNTWLMMLGVFIKYIYSKSYVGTVLEFRHFLSAKVKKNTC
jgi:hypothetical protein